MALTWSRWRASRPAKLLTNLGFWKTLQTRSLCQNHQDVKDLNEEVKSPPFLFRDFDGAGGRFIYAQIFEEEAVLFVHLSVKCHFKAYLAGSDVKISKFEKERLFLKT